MPNAMTSGLYCALFGLIVAVGLSNLQYVDLNSPRNQFIIGFAIFNCMSVAGPGGYFSTVQGNPFGESSGADILFAIFSSPMIIAFLGAFILDNTTKGSREERGLHVWDAIKPHDVNNDPEYVEVYSFPSDWQRSSATVATWSGLGPPVNGYVSSGADLGDLCCPCWCATTPPEEAEIAEDPREDNDEVEEA